MLLLANGSVRHRLRLSVVIVLILFEGYGATTLPALTESFTIERNTTLAKYEVGRLKGLIDKLADELKASGCAHKHRRRAVKVF